MKIIYQQIISFVTLLTITLVITSVSFIQSTRRLVYSNTWTQLESYADALQENGWNRIGNVLQPNRTFILEMQNLLISQDVHFVIYNSENLPIFPTNAGAISSISGSTWNQLLNGKTIRVSKTPKKTVPTERQHIDQTAIYKPYFYNNKLLCVIAVTSSVQGVQKNIQNIESNLLLAIVISSAVAVVIIYLLSNLQSRRINRMRRATKEISAGNYDVVIPVTNTKDELNGLSHDFNNMSKNLKEANLEIERQEERRRQFMADAAHEMRTPLTTINGLLEGLAYDAIPEEEKGKSIDLMRKETSRLIKLVNENLDYERIRTNQIKLNKTTFDSTEALQNIAFQLEKKAAESGDTIKYLPEHESAKKIPIYADYDRFVEVVINIANNAIQFTKDGNITLKNERGFKETKVTISDTGIGMTEEQTKNIWDRYYKADPSRKNTKYGESGLGLSIVQQLVKLHGGEIEVQSKIDQGTTFTLLFPDGEEDNG
ncbi:sensor histidine kinase [Xylocopilactobacillus apicola]|uniref:histidine kinase n=1 Tax=Xylocopilactobacillus apicola TaxID=2932184 RepID=A0AAU9DR85_9LACO|nr:HAMP domain-containing sensor histidine kinase [Xylocopilactobacillus apicola]BDR58444.1 two-component sensor histidine kinase [Xylocopilactobacillus apicola]